MASCAAADIEGRHRMTGGETGRSSGDTDGHATVSRGMAVFGAPAVTVGGRKPGAYDG